MGLVGDACHVASGTTHYEWDGVPAIWRSAIWFPVMLSSAVLAAAWAGERAGLPAIRMRRRVDALTGAAAILGLYALTAALRGEPVTVSVALTAAVAVVIFAWWDPSPRVLRRRRGRGRDVVGYRPRRRVALAPLRGRDGATPAYGPP